jgi:hypothetical protein
MQDSTPHEEREFHVRAAYASVMSVINAIDQAPGIYQGRWWNRRKTVAQAQLAQAYALKAVALLLYADETSDR